MLILYTSCEKRSCGASQWPYTQVYRQEKRTDSFTAEQISDVETWCNSLPRKILGYWTPDEIFEKELDKIYHVDVI